MKIVYFFTLILFSLNLIAQQDAKLARHYYQVGEYEKAAQLYKKLSDQYGYNDYYFNNFVESLLALEDYDRAKQSLEETIKVRPNNIELYVAMGNLLERTGYPEEAEIQFRLAISKITPQNVQIVSNLGNSFMRLIKYDLALEAFLKGEEMSNHKGLFSYSIAELYRLKNEHEKMIHYYLKSHVAKSQHIENVKQYFDRHLTGQNQYEMLRKELYQKVQEQPDNIFYPEMIQWVFVQKKEYLKALRQARALDMRLEENGSRIYSIAKIAANDKDYDTAIAAFEYIVEHKSSSAFYVDANRELLAIKRKKIVNNADYSIDDLYDLKREYDIFLDQNGRNSRTSLIVIQLAELEALYLNDLDTAILILNELLEYPGMNNYILANAKLNLADYYLMTGDIWESTLLCSQVDKVFREDYLGEKARFKNAKLSYYNGDFEWAQEQFNILKRATTRLIANDAIDLSVFIMDHINLDTTTAPLQLFAEAELLFFQNKTSHAYQKLDSIKALFPDHDLVDDVYYIKANHFRKTGQIDEAITLYQNIINDYPDGIRCDNALYALAEIYEDVVGDTEKAKEYYQKVFIDYADSTFAIEARKSYRRLRGDTIQ